MDTSRRRASTKRVLLGGFVAGGAGLAWTSAAFACTIFLGQMGLEGNARNPETGKRSEVTVSGSSRGMSYCNGYESVQVPGVTTVAPAGRLVNKGAGETFLDSKLGVGANEIFEDESPRNSVKVSLAPLDDDACEDHAGPRHWGGQLPDGRYNVNFQNGPAFTGTGDTRRWFLDCMWSSADFPDDPTLTAVRVGTIEVRNGAASGSFKVGENLVPNSPGDESALCVSNQRGDFKDINGVSSDDAGIGTFGMQAPIVVL